MEVTYELDDLKDGPGPELCGRQVHISGGYFGPCDYEKGKCPLHDKVTP